MYTSRITLFLLALVIALASAAPLHRHHRRGKCPHTPATSLGDTEEPAPTYAPPPRVKNVDGEPSPSPSPTTKVSSDDEPAESSFPVPEETSKPKPSSSTSNDDPVPTRKSSSGSGYGSGKSLDGLLGDLFPKGSGESSWSTCPQASDSIPLSDASLGATDIMRSLNHEYINNPFGDGKVLHAHYPKGSLNPAGPNKGGVSFYAKGPIDLSDAKEVTCGYSVYFPKGFDFVLGGKLPGPYGGDNEDAAKGCSGGARKMSCFSARLMWRTGGQGEYYLYMPPTGSNKAKCSKDKDFECNDTYGISVGRGNFKFTPGQWTTVAQRVKLNDAGETNGEVELFVDGQSRISANGLELRTNSKAGARGMMVQSFFGGSQPQFKNTKNQDVYFKDFSCAITQ